MKFKIVYFVFTNPHKSLTYEDFFNYTHIKRAAMLQYGTFHI